MQPGKFAMTQNIGKHKVIESDFNDAQPGQWQECKCSLLDSWLDVGLDCPIVVQLVSLSD
jgi:hypothetical protein